VLLGVITIGSAAAFGWLGWEMLRQDADAEAQREQERLGHEADRAAQAMDRRIADVEARLSEWTASSARLEAPGDGVTVVFRAGIVEVARDARLLYYPSLAARAEPSPALFSMAKPRSTAIEMRTALSSCTAE
jgi:hypothetical protein